MAETLHLNLKKQWFDMILSGKKTTEYRDIKKYWARRFLWFMDVGGMEWPAVDEMIGDLQRPSLRHKNLEELLDYFNVKMKDFDTVTFRNGYKKNAPGFVIEFNGITVNTGRSDWGAEVGEFYFCLELGKIIKGK